VVPRTWKLDPSVTRALTKWKAIRYPEPDEKPPANALVLVDEIGAGWEGARFAEMFRADLQTAGVKRPELFEKVAGVRAPIRAHDLRSSFVTVKLAIGWPEAQISARTGHQSSQMIGRCRRVARTAEELDVGDFSPLDVLLFGAEETEDEVAAEESPAADPVPQPIVGLQSGLQDEPVQNTQPLCEDEGPSFSVERVVGQPGLEPETNGLRVHCSTN